MAIEDLVGLEAPEKSLQDELIFEIQSQYELYKPKCYFLKLERVSASTSKVIWIKEFDNPQALDDFYDDSVYYRACIMFKFCKDHYKVLWEGFHWANSFQIHTDCIDRERPQTILYNIETYKMLPKELVQAGISELKGLLIVSARDTESK
jgi:hypothetical protein